MISDYLCVLLCAHIDHIQNWSLYVSTEFLHVPPVCAPSDSFLLPLCSRVDCTRILIPHVAIAHEHPTDSLFLLYTRIECLSKGGDLGQPHRSSDKKEQSCSLGLGLDTWVMTCSIIRMSCLPFFRLLKNFMAHLARKTWLIVILEGTCNFLMFSSLLLLT